LPPQPVFNSRKTIDDDNDKECETAEEGEDNEGEDNDFDDDNCDNGASDGGDTHDPNSVMGVYLKALQHQLMAETVTDKRGKIKWLVPFLQKSGWWICGNRDSASVCRRLGVRLHPHRALYCDVRVWLRDLEFGLMPPCVNDNCPVHYASFDE
jgi:hypothetical protein